MLFRYHFMNYREILYLALPSRQIALTISYLRSNMTISQPKFAKSGTLFRSIEASGYLFSFTATVYAGKQTEDLIMHYARKTEKTVKFMIQLLKSQNDLQGGYLSNDRLFRSVALAKWLLTKSITSAGTFKVDWKGIPEEIISVSQRESQSHEVHWKSLEGVYIHISLPPQQLWKKRYLTSNIHFSYA